MTKMTNSFSSKAQIAVGSGKVELYRLDALVKAGVGDVATLLLVLNAWHEGVRVTLPEAADGKGWIRLIDTNLPDSADEQARFEIGATYDVTGRSFLLFLLQAEGR